VAATGVAATVAAAAAAAWAVSTAAAITAHSACLPEHSPSRCQGHVAGTEWGGLSEARFAPARHGFSEAGFVTARRGLP